MPTSRSEPDEAGEPAYVLDNQVGFLLRRAYQRNSTIFSALVPGHLTTTQFSVMHRLAADGPTSQNSLGRSAAMDGATTKGVIDRLIARHLVARRPDPADRRRHLVFLTEAGITLTAEAEEAASRVTDETLDPLTTRERATFLRLLRKLV